MTAIQELIYDLRNNNDVSLFNEIHMQTYIEKEKIQILKAFEFGVADAYNYNKEEGEQYYIDTLKNK